MLQHNDTKVLPLYVSRMLQNVTGSLECFKDTMTNGTHVSDKTIISVSSIFQKYDIYTWYINHGKIYWNVSKALWTEVLQYPTKFHVCFVQTNSKIQKSASQVRDLSRFLLTDGPTNSPAIIQSIVSAIDEMSMHVNSLFSHLMHETCKVGY